MTAVPKPRLTPEQYLAIERKAELRSELFDGRMVLMPVTNVWHSVIKVNCIGQIGMQLKGGPCHSYSTDMRLKVPRTNSYAYPDIIVVCGEPQAEDAEDDTLLNPRVIIEIHSPATEAYDRGKKLHHYQQIDSLHEYVLVAQAEPVVDRYVRQADGSWAHTFVEGLDRDFAFATVPVHVRLADVYVGVTFPEPAGRA